MSVWISVDDRLPEIGQTVDVWAIHPWGTPGGSRYADMVYLNPAMAPCPWGGDDPLTSEFRVTHWMPVPEGPSVVDAPRGSLAFVAGTELRPNQPLVIGEDGKIYPWPVQGRPMMTMPRDVAKGETFTIDVRSEKIV